MRTKLQENEKIIYIARKHWIVFVWGLLISATAVLGAYLIQMTFWGILAGIAILVYVYLERKFNIWVVTNKRLIDEKGIIFIYSKETPIDKIHNVTFSKDVLGRILGYGIITIQSAAELGLTKANFVAKPELLQVAIIEAQNQLVSQNIEPQDVAPCPLCKELIKKDALKCRFCGTVLTTVPIENILRELSKETRESINNENSGNNQELKQESKIEESNMQNKKQETIERRGRVWRPYLEKE